MHKHTLPCIAIYPIYPLNPPCKVISNKTSLISCITNKFVRISKLGQLSILNRHQFLYMKVILRFRANAASILLQNPCSSLLKEGNQQPNQTSQGRKLERMMDLREILRVSEGAGSWNERKWRRRRRRRMKIKEGEVSGEGELAHARMPHSVSPTDIFPQFDWGTPDLDYLSRLILISTNQQLGVKMDFGCYTMTRDGVTIKLIIYEIHIYFFII